ncbi:hypothetical protein LEP1GSC058_2923 [Leptospira fainei serovar Hurstbridge str. BUT 6]|uniref:Uncharacterized protein n=1 Tax=Leptospira fainei serovar Hurstbridge str. BUT 6 TaxID=1193011 RepID=S3UYB4_9LEPT|nr:hypothetical protein LEP1GSC058_2923 [Leptospira fainei serovar Hurstbridge str. BUT 6]
MFKKRKQTTVAFRTFRKKLTKNPPQPGRFFAPAKLQM